MLKNYFKEIWPGGLENHGPRLCAIIGVYITLLCSPGAYSQELPGKPDSIFSEVLKEKRVLQVILPNDYKPGSLNKYAVVYLLDGIDNISLFHQIQQLAEREKYVPKLIVVAVFNTDRSRDLTPTPLKYIRNSGGAANFLSFFKQELVPYINKTYPAKGENILYGHSFGGLFATYAMLHEPQLFASYIAVDPSFWYDGGYTKKLALEKLNILSNQQKTFFIRKSGSVKRYGH